MIAVLKKNAFNRVWISDLFPRVKEDASARGPHLHDSKTNFKKYLVMYLEYYKEARLSEWIERVKNHDMTSAK